MPGNFVSNRDQTIPLFKSPWLERLSHVHPATPALVFLPAAAFFFWLCLHDCSLLLAASLVLSGILIWTLVEYVMHRWVFHYQPTSTLGRKIHHLTHGIHHDFPRDSTRLVMPPAVSLPLALLFWFLFRGLIGVRYEGVFAGFLIGYVLYDTIHYATHHWRMDSRLGRFLKEYHLKHHYQDDDLSYGVSSPLWDYVFGTTAKSARREG